MVSSGWQGLSTGSGISKLATKKAHYYLFHLRFKLTTKSKPGGAASSDASWSDVSLADIEETFLFEFDPTESERCTAGKVFSFKLLQIEDCVLVGAAKGTIFGILLPSPPLLTRKYFNLMQYFEFKYRL